MATITLLVQLISRDLLKEKYYFRTQTFSSQVVVADFLLMGNSVGRRLRIPIPIPTSIPIPTPIPFHIPYHINTPIHIPIPIPIP